MNVISRYGKFSLGGLNRSTSPIFHQIPANIIRLSVPVKGFPHIFFILCFSFLPISINLVGCGGDDDDGAILPGPSYPSHPSDTGDPDAGGLEPDASRDAEESADTSPDAAEAGGDGSDAGPGDARREPYCHAIDLGVIAPDGSSRVTVDMADAANRVQPSCTPGVAKEMIFSFSTERTSRVEIRPVSAQIGDLLLQIDRGPCAETEEVACFDSGAQNMIAEAGVEYYLLLESATGAASGELELVLDTEALECFPAASSSCADDETVLYCGSGFVERSHTCSLGCSDGACAGEYCDNQIPMDSDGFMRLEGSLDGYTSRFNMRDRAECFDSGLPLATDGPEVLVALPGIQAGQVVRIDVSEEVGDFNDNAVFIVEDCGRTPTCVAGSDAEKYEWIAAEDGDYTLIIDTVSTASSEFVYEIAVE